jgi:hypothetical protein
VRSALAVTAQIKDVSEAQRINRGKVCIIGLMVLARAPKKTAPQPPAACQSIAAIVSKVVDTVQFDDSRRIHAINPLADISIA